MGTVGVGGGRVAQDDFLQALKKKHKGGGGEARWAGSVIGTTVGDADEREVLVEGGPVQRVSDWRPSKRAKVVVDENEAGMAT